MELVAFLRLLRRHRILVALGAVVAIAMGAMLMRGEPSRFGVAGARVVVDTGDSQLLDAEAEGGDTLTWRTRILADMMTGPPATTNIARVMHVRPSALAVVAPHLAVSETTTPLTEYALQAAAVTPEPYLISVRFDDVLPIIWIDSRAPDPARAAQLVQAVTRELKAAASTPEHTPDIQDLAIEPTGPIRTKMVVSGPRRVAAVGGAVVLFCLWCVGLALASGLLRAWRSVGRTQAGPRREHFPAAGPLPALGPATRSPEERRPAGR